VEPRARSPAVLTLTCQPEAQQIWRAPLGAAACASFSSSSVLPPNKDSDSGDEKSLGLATCSGAAAAFGGVTNAPAAAPAPPAAPPVPVPGRGAAGGHFRCTRLPRKPAPGVAHWPATALRMCGLASSHHHHARWHLPIRHLATWHLATWHLATCASAHRPSGVASCVQLASGPLPSWPSSSDQT